MCVVNDKYHYIFMHEPHTGGTSVHAALMQHEGSSDFNGETHIGPVQMIDAGWVSEEQFDAYLKFHVFRNPYDLLVTRWHRHCRCPIPLFDWLMGNGLGNIQGGTLFWRYAHCVEYQFRFECLQKHLDSVMHVLDAPQVKLGHLGKTPYKIDWRDVLTVSQALQVEEMYPDIKAYGYSLFRE